MQTFDLYRVSAAVDATVAVVVEVIEACVDDHRCVFREFDWHYLAINWQQLAFENSALLQNLTTK